MKFKVKEDQRKEDQFQEQSFFENIIRFILSSPITDSSYF